MLKLCKGLSPGKPISIGGFKISPSKNSLKLNIPLTGSIAPLKGAQVTPTFNRDTAATVVDNEGVIHTALINEIRFPNARRVENLLYNTEVLSTQTVTVLPGNSYILSFSGNGSVTLSGAATGTLSGSTGRVQVTKAATTSSLTLTVLGTVLQAQFERVSGTQTIASEYVSKGVLSWPYHGCGVDGVKYFNTDRNGANLDIPGALIEPSATNIITYSEALSSWLNDWGGGTTLTANATLGPHGRYVYKVSQVDSPGDAIYIAATLTITTHTVTLLAKTYNAKQSRLLIRDRTTLTTVASLAFDWTDGVPSTATATNVSNVNYTPLWDEWYIITFNFTSVSSGTHQFVFYPEVLKTDTLGVYFGGLHIQVETGLVASSYIYTSGATVTRTADLPVYDVADVITQGQGSLYCEAVFKGLLLSTTYFLSMDDATSSNRISLYISSGTTLYAVMTASGTTGVVSSVTTVSKDTLYKILITYQDNAFKVYINGSLAITDTSCNVPTSLSTLRFAKYNGGDLTVLQIKNVKYYSDVLTETKAIRMTT